MVIWSGYVVQNWWMRTGWHW